MKKPLPLSYKQLRQKLNPNQLDFETTSELETLTEFIGQERALEAIHFGISIKSQGYNIYAMGPSGIGKRTLVRTILVNKAKKQKAPPDWCYIHNFEIPEKPIPLQLPSGTAVLLQQDMKSFIHELSSSILSVFESHEYRSEMEKITKDFNLKREEFCKQVIKDSQNNKTPHLYKERHEKEEALQLRFTTAVVEPLIKKLKAKYKKITPVVTYLMNVQKDIIAHVNDFVQPDETTSVLSFASESPVLVKYQVNVLVDNSKQKGTPIVFENNPSYSNLICHVEHTAQLGTLLTNFTLIRPGALHKANGGYLVVEARKLKKEKHAWEGLKRALYSRKITIEPIEHMSETARPVSLEPMPIPLNVKIILLGDRSTYYSFCNNDPDFSELFKVAVDFDEQIDRSRNNITRYARLIGTIAKKEGLRPFSASAVAAIIDHSTRIAEDINKLSTHIRSIDDLILESDYWAGQQEKKTVEASDVKRAIDAQIHRLDRARELYYEEIDRNFILIKTEGEAIGQVNCLSVVKVGNFSYGHPTKLTAKVRAGRGRVVDIQHEICLSGPIMSKGCMIITNFLASHYNSDRPFSLCASLSFEQIYGTMEGDSASIAELCTLLSALADIPIQQSIAITGSVTQYGETQAVGGINEKIEGFFDICKSRGLNGKHGVIIPVINTKNLMLREDVVQAAKERQFHIYPVETVDQAITLLTGIPAGKRQKNGLFPVNSVNYLVENKLQVFANVVKKR